MDAAGVPVAEAEFLLPKGSELNVSGTKVSSGGNGEFAVESSFPVVQLPDGRMVFEFDREIWEANQKVAVTAENDEGKTRVTLTTNCKDVSKVPPDVRSNGGFSPSKRGTGPALGSYKGFGHR